MQGASSCRIRTKNHDSPSQIFLKFSWKALEWGNM